MIIIYNILIFIGIILLFPLMIPMILLSGKRRKTVLQRLGIAKPDIPHPTSHNRIWVHALSVGEVLSAVPLIEKLRDRFGAQEILFSASTQTGFEIANERLRKYADGLFFFPYDFILSVKHIAKKVRPDIVVIVETDIWPNFLFEMERQNVPVILANARLSKKSFSGYRRFSFTKSLFSKFSKICAQSDKDARRFRHLGTPSDSVMITGNVKFDQAAPTSDADIESLKDALNIRTGRRIILAGSTHKGEETILSEAFSRIRKTDDDLLMIVVPRNPERGGSVRRIFESAGFSAFTMSELKESPHEKTDVIVIDVIGLLTKLYALADIAFVGGSLTRFGGHNPLEPAIFSKPILFGPDMSDFAEISEMLLDAGGAVQVNDAESFHETATLFLRDEEKARKTGEQAFKVFQANKGAVQKTLDVIGKEI